MDSAPGQRGAPQVVRPRPARRRPGSAARRLGGPSASMPRWSVAAKRGESDRFTPGAPTRSSEPPGQRAAALGVREPVEGRAAEQVEQRANRGRLAARPCGRPGSSGDGLAGQQLALAAARRPNPPGRAALAATLARPAPAAAAARARCRSPSCRRPWSGRSRRRPRWTRPPAPPRRRSRSPCASRPAAAATAKAAARARAARVGVEGRGGRVVPLVPRARARARRSRGTPAASRAGVRSGRRHGGRTRARRLVARVVRSSARPTWPSRTTATSTVRSSTDVGLGGPVGGEAQQQRALARDRDERVPAAPCVRAPAPRGRRTSGNPHLHVPEASRVRCRARRARTGPARPSRSRSGRWHASRRGADRVAAAPELRASGRSSSGCAAAGRARRHGSPRPPRPRTGSAAAGRRSTTSGWSRSAGRARCRRSGRRATRPSPGSRFTFVMRTSGCRAKPSARAQPPERSRPISAAVSREERKPGEHARRARSARPAPSTPSSSQRNVPSAAGRGRVARDVHKLRAEPERAGCVRRRRSCRPRRRSRAPSTRSSSTAWPIDSWICSAELLAGEDQRRAAVRTRRARAAAPPPPPRWRGARSARPSAGEVLVAGLATCPPCDAG